MISIPVKLYGATESKDLAFNTLHAECKSRLKQKRWCPVHDREVTADEVVRAFEYSKDQYVEIDDQDLENLPVPSKHTIELTVFVKQSDIDPVYYERTYYLEPEQVGLKPYALLMRALKTKQVCAVAKIALRNKESLSVLRPTDNNMLMLETLYYPDEIRTQDLPGTPEVMVSQPELNMALSLVEMLEEPFDPNKYRDEYRDALIATIEAKRNGDQIVATPQAPVPQAVDLMAALKASLEAARKRGGAADAAVEEAAPAAGRDSRKKARKGKGEPEQAPEEAEELAVAF
ncbi:MAG: Ku protein [Chloroflexota bacterium]|nr:Ku protein [Chloroflexota bacterium]